MATIASNLGVALENARLFDETKRLLTETDERAAELAIINSVQQGLAEHLEMQAMYDLVANKLHEIFDPDISISIGLYDLKSETIEFPAAIERGEPLVMPPARFGLLTRMVASHTAPVQIDDFGAWMAEQGQDLAAVGEMPKSVLQAPLLSGGKPFGRISLENVDRTSAFSKADVRLLSTLASSLSVALENARLFNETQRLLTETNERAAELAIINSVQEGLAAKLDMQSMYDLVGDKIQEIFDAQVVAILLYDHEREMARYPYVVERGVRFDNFEAPFVETTHLLMRTRAPIHIDDLAAWSEETGVSVPAATGELPKSILTVPLMTGDQVFGAISLQNLDRESAFAEADVRLLSTLAGSLSVALENARLFGETQRLLTETNERAAELAIINSVQEGLAARLDMQAMYDLVGDKIGEIFDVDGVDIESYDKASNTIFFKYTVERGERLPTDPMPLMGFRKQVVETRAPLLVNHDLEARAAEAGQPAIVAGELAKSALWVPLINGNEVTGIVLIENLEREGAFTDRDVRLLTTMASSLSVALENARLFGETERLLTETNERAAELAIINSVQHGLAAQLDMQAMYDLVGDKIQEIFDAQVAEIGLYDLETETVHYPYAIERGVRFPDEPTAMRQNSRALVADPRPIVINDVAAWSEMTGTEMTVQQGEVAQSVALAPLVRSGQTFGHISLQNLDHTNAFSDGDVRLLSTLASSLSVALENARLFDETQRLLTETNERAAELAIINSVQQGLAAKLDMQSMYDLVGDKVAEIFDTQVVDISVYDLDREMVTSPYVRERGERLETDWGEFGPMIRLLLERRAAFVINDVDSMVA